MARGAPERRSRPRLGSTVLLLAWLVLLGSLAGVAGYVLMLPEEQVQAAVAPAVVVPLPAQAGEPEPEPTITAPTVPAPEPAAPPEVPAATAEAAPAQAEPAVADAEDPAPQQPAAAAVAPEPPPAEPAPAAEEPALAEAPPAQDEPAAAAAPAPEEPSEASDAPPAMDSDTPPAPVQEARVPSAGAPEPAWKRNRQPFDDTAKRPRIAVVITGLGLSSTATEMAIRELPAAVTLSFTPYTRGLDGWVRLARADGHEVMLDLPMEPTSYPDDDPGPQALLTALSPAQNLERLNWTLGRAEGYVGVVPVMGSRFTASPDHLTPVLEALKQEGLLFLDNRASDRSIAGALAGKLGLMSAINDRSLDSAHASRTTIDARLVQLEEIARAEGAAIGIARPYPATIERLLAWAEELEARGLVLAPISAVAQQERRRSAAAQSSQAP